MRVFVSAAPTVRHLCLPRLVEGFEAEVPPGQHTIEIYALLPTRDFTAREGPIPEVEELVLTGRPTGRTYRGLPWWEVA